MASHLGNLSTRALLSHRPNCTLTFLTRTRARNTNTALPTPLTHRKTMATEAPKKIEWLVVVPDFAGAHEKRLEVRPQHFANLGPSKDSGLIQMGGAVLNDPPTSSDPSTFSFAGSTLVLVAATRDEVKEILRQDIYAAKGVWDVENVSLFLGLLLLPLLPLPGSPARQR
ncbi:hypothetical protein BT67DRAFT_27256 [Trichocladium antarcticum]|uniref:YCII-related domain-containing protein n=1 Tax=Trichocladium antarcticum TaxID=1450529 RepID=A0AAN6UTS4_9PEZI|nr:hypothetical protein BT67DRAFT_27256 [Trichocladium antarcticum]